MFDPILYVSPPGFYKLQGKASSQGTCDYVMVILPIFLHIYGVYITTNRNWLYECFPGLFLDNAVGYCGTSSLFFQTFWAYKIYDKRHAKVFYSNEFFTIINIIHRIWTVMVEGNMKPRKKWAGGNRLGGLPRPVKIQASAAQSPLLWVTKFTVSDVIWEDLMPVLNYTVANMRGFLT